MAGTAVDIGVNGRMVDVVLNRGNAVVGGCWDD